MKRSDAHRAQTPDRLHTNHGGVFPVHLWGQMKRHLDALGRKAIEQVDAQYVLVVDSFTLILIHAQ